MLPSFAPLAEHPAVRALLAATAGAECHLVGGVLRDFALGLPVHDVDVVVSGRGREVTQAMATLLSARFILLGGKEFGAYRLVYGEEGVDLWDREGMSVHDDLARRDFTVNAFAWEPRSGQVVDPFGGLPDLERRRLRATTAESFTGDPLRLLRLPRLLLRLPGFDADPGTVELARRSAARLPEVAVERIRDELAQLFSHPEIRRGVELLAALDLYPGLWRGRPGEPGRQDEIAEALALLERLAEAVRELEERASGLLPAGFDDSLRAARLAASFLPVGALTPGPSPGAGEGNDAERWVALWSEVGYLTRKDAEAVKGLLRETELPEGEIAGRRFLFRAGEALWAAALCWLGAREGLSPPWRDVSARLLDLVAGGGGERFRPTRLLSGLDVQQIAGIPPGPELGRVLAALEAEQVDGRVTTREAAERWLRGRAAAR